MIPEKTFHSITDILAERGGDIIQGVGDAGIRDDTRISPKQPSRWASAR